MKVLPNSLLLAMILGGPIATATASSVITSATTASGAGLGSFSVDEVEDLITTFSSVNPITLTFTVTRSEASGTPYGVNEDITNGTSWPFTNFHLQITDGPDAPPNGVVFTSFDPNDASGPNFMPSFTLDPPFHAQPAPFQPTGTRDLNFTGQLAAGDTAFASHFSLSIPDPVEGDDTYTFMLTQTPTVIPEPETYVLMLAGLCLVGFMARCRKPMLNAS